MENKEATFMAYHLICIINKSVEVQISVKNLKTPAILLSSRKRQYFLAFFVSRRRSYVRCLHAQLYYYFDTIISKISPLFPKNITIVSKNITIVSKNITFISKKDTVHRKKTTDIGWVHDALLGDFHHLIHYPLTTKLLGLLA